MGAVDCGTVVLKGRLRGAEVEVWGGWAKAKQPGLLRLYLEAVPNMF